MVSVMSSMVLMATCRLITPSTARYTTPIPPLASTSFSSYRPFSLVEAGISWSDYTARIGLKGRADGPSAAIQTVGGALRGKEGGGGVVETENGRNARAAVRWVRMRGREGFMAMDGPES